jgi:hypothetical protein
MSLQVGDRIRVTDTSGFEDLNPFDLLMYGSPALGEEGTVVQTDFDSFEHHIPEGGQPLFVEFEGGRKYGLLSTEVEAISEEVAA